MIVVLGLLVLMRMVSSLAPPSFIGPWHHLNAKATEDHEFTENHNLGQLPVYVDVQVQPRYGNNVEYTFPGVGSAQSSSFDVSEEIGGVVYMYDETKVVVKCPDGTNSKMQVIFTGEDWTPTYQQKEVEAWVRVRVWLPADFPSPLFSSAWLPVSVNDEQKTHLVVDTGLSAGPFMNYFFNVKVKVTDGGPLNGMVCDAQGSSMAFTSSSQWGGVIYQSIGSDIHIWTPAYNEASPGKGSICNMAEGWGSVMKGYGDEGLVSIQVFDVLGYESLSNLTIIRVGSSNQKEHASGSVDIDNEIITGKVYQTFYTKLHVWPAMGGVFYPADAGLNYGGVVYAYSQSSVRIWYPDSNSGFYIDQNWGTETSITTFKDWVFVSKVYKVSECGAPTIVVNGDYTVHGNAPFLYGTEVTYSCYSGTFLISGDIQRTCSHDGWNGSVPVCGLAVDCGHPAEVSNGKVSFTATNEGDTAEVTCFPGFDRIGFLIITCQANRTWSDVPICVFNDTLVNCSIPPDVQNGTVDFLKNITLEGDAASISCDTGFNISGDHLITCQSNGTWSHLPTCNALNCAIPPDVPNGSVIYIQNHTIVGDTANVTCNEGFNIIGNPIISCQSDGTWSPLPVCNVRDCSTPSDVSNGSVIYIQNHTSVGDTANVTCNVGFNIIGNSIISCQSDGTWSPLPVCNVRDCSTPSDVSNGSVIYIPNHTIVGDTANVTCNVGFNIIGNSIISCQSDGTWSPLPVCNVRDCSIPLDVSNSSVTYTPNHTIVGDTANLTCYEVRVMDKTESKRVQTRTYKPYNTIVGDTANITCNEGLNISGNSVLPCQSNGTWSPSPFCVNKDCSIPPDVSNGSVTFIPNHSIVGDTTNVTCNEGFHISGNSIISCQSDGSWSPLPVCNIINCFIPLGVSNGVLTYIQNHTTVGSSANVTCNEGFNISGNSIISCQSNGTWSPPPFCNILGPKTCLCDCDRVTQPVAVIEIKTLEDEIEMLVKNLTVETKSTSKYRRTKESAEDDRASATTLGYFGGAIMGVTAAFIIVLDVVNLYKLFL